MRLLSGGVGDLWESIRSVRKNPYVTDPPRRLLFSAIRLLSYHCCCEIPGEDTRWEGRWFKIDGILRAASPGKRHDMRADYKRRNKDRPHGTKKETPRFHRRAAGDDRPREINQERSLEPDKSLLISNLCPLGIASFSTASPFDCPFLSSSPLLSGLIASPPPSPLVVVAISSDLVQ